MDISKPIKCDECKRKTCLVTKTICEKMENWLKENVEKTFWHGVQGYMPDGIIKHMDKVMYGIEPDDVTE